MHAMSSGEVRLGMLGHLIVDACSQVHKTLTTLARLLLSQIELACGLYLSLLCILRS